MRPIHWTLLVLAGLAAGCLPLKSEADALTDQMRAHRDSQIVSVTVNNWRFRQPDVPGGEAVNFDDTSWQVVSPGHQWQGNYTSVWYRKTYVVPATVNGVSTQGAGLEFRVGVDDDGDIYVNGEFRTHFHWDEGRVQLTDHTYPGQVFVIAVRGINVTGPGSLRNATMAYDLLGPVQPDYNLFIVEAEFTGSATGVIESSQVSLFNQTLQQAEAMVNMNAVQARNWPVASASLAAARQELLTLAPITRQFDLYYVGHAHIDMNWLWDWPETIDVCHRTWNSAMKLMGEFPDFVFVQSQPGAYVPIQQMFPTQFSQMQAMGQGGQWSVVGGLWTESDTNLPSGEGLARSFLLGQRYFKQYFGRYAETGWLPDSFGHSWQLPQIMQLSGIRNFYHERCPTGVLGWWQSPDGSRVLKASTEFWYNANVEAGQLLGPWRNWRNVGMKKAIVVYGVGDHGGGPTRAMISKAKEFEASPMLPAVHLVSADEFFDAVRSDAKSATLPIVSTDLQYTFTGCYTSHADVKTDLRISENNLYTAEVLSSLAAMRGQRYPTTELNEAWQPTVFSQFHDILDGTAIHSTYTWMHEQMLPALQFEQEQIADALAALTRTVDTRGGLVSEYPVVVWNALSFPNADVVRVTVPDASRYSSVRTPSGRIIAAQPIGAQTVAFIAEPVSGFGHATYFLGNETPTESAVTVTSTASAFVLENAFLRVTIAQETGLMTGLFDKSLNRELIASGQAGNLLQVLGDTGNAWDINYTGEKVELTTGAVVSVLRSGPVEAVVRVTHTLGNSVFTQDVTLRANQKRIDVPAVVDWRHRQQLLKVAFPLAMAAARVRVGIPYGSIDRPGTGQENPGQKWMDVTNMQNGFATGNVTLDLAGLYNHRSWVDFDDGHRGYPQELMPTGGYYSYGAAHVTFRMPARNLPDNIVCAGQTIAVPDGAFGNTLYVLGGSAPTFVNSNLALRYADETNASVPFSMSDWVVGGGVNNESAKQLAYRLDTDGSPDYANRPHLWIYSVGLPAGKRPIAIVLPNDARAHVFAVTIANAPRPQPQYGVTFLNNCKYGSDTNGNVFRLTLLRSSNDPDPNPDEGIHNFTYSIMPHSGDWRDAQAEQAGLQLNIPLRAVATVPHGGINTPKITIAPSENVIAGALKYAEDGTGYILRIFETQGRDTPVTITFDRPVKLIETDILERPLRRRAITTQSRGMSHGFTIGHDQIVTLRILGLPEPNPDTSEPGPLPRQVD